MKKLNITIIVLSFIFNLNTSAQTFEFVKDINPGAGDSSPNNLTEYNNNLCFSADDGTNGKELWVTDGTTSGTLMLKDINSGARISHPSDIKENNNHF